MPTLTYAGPVHKDPELLKAMREGEDAHGRTVLCECCPPLVVFPGQQVEMCEAKAWALLGLGFA